MSDIHRLAISFLMEMFGTLKQWVMSHIYHPDMPKNLSQVRGNVISCTNLLYSNQGYNASFICNLIILHFSNKVNANHHLQYIDLRFLGTERCHLYSPFRRVCKLTQT